MNTERLLQLVLVAVGGAVGAAIRWTIADAWVTNGFPWPTLIVNVVGCALLAIFTADGIPTTVQRLLGAGMCGGLTTFSTLSIEVVQLLETDQRITAITYVAASVTLGLAAFIGARATRSTPPVGAR